MTCEDMERAHRDYMEWCIDWAMHRLHQLAYITEEMAPNGLRSLALDICLAARGATKEIRSIMRSTCERLPRGVRPNLLRRERRAGSVSKPYNIKEA